MKKLSNTKAELKKKSVANKKIDGFAMNDREMILAQTLRKIP